MLKLNLAIAKEVATGKGKIDIFFECFSDHRTLLSGNGVYDPCDPEFFPVTPDIISLSSESSRLEISALSSGVNGRSFICCKNSLRMASNLN